MSLIESLLETLTISQLGPDLFRGVSPKKTRRRVFGGQVLAQALLAAGRTVEGRDCHSLHAYFLRPGNPIVPIQYEVDRARDGGSFSARRVTARQDSHVIFVMAASFQKPEEGFEHFLPMPDVPAPETLESGIESRRRAAQDMPEEARAWLLRERPIEIRPVEPLDRFTPVRRLPRQMFWFRCVGHLPDDPALHRAVLAYASDMTLLDSSLLPHGVSLVTPQMQIASLDHALWFHRPMRMDEWLLSVQDSPSACQGRGYNRGLIYAHDGRLVASVAQEGLIRWRGNRPQV